MVREKTVQQTGRALATLVAIAMWITGILVALAVGFGMTSGALSIPWLPDVHLYFQCLIQWNKNQVLPKL